MLATLALSPSFHSLPGRPCLLSSARPALADCTNVNPRSDACSPAYPKRLVYPTSSARTGCGWSDVESSTSAPSPSHHHYLSSTPSPFAVTYKALPTVSISFSAARSQSIPGEPFCGSGVQGLESDLPDVRSVVPFPCTSLDGDMDVEMLDGTCGPSSDGHLPSAGQAPRKRRSAHSSVSSSQGCFGKDANQKRPRKSKRQVTELWWLGVVHRSILRNIEARQSRELDSFRGVLSGPRDFDAMDRMLVERMHQRLTQNGCVEGRHPTHPLPRISSPRISVPSLSLLAPSRKAFPIDSASLPKENDALDGLVTPSQASKASHCASSPISSHSPIPSTTSASLRRHVRFEIAERPRRSQSHPGVPRRSPSPPARTGAVPANGQTLTLTMPQLVASLMLAYHDKSKMRSRGRTCRPAECEKNTGRFPPSMPCQVVRCDDSDAIQEKEKTHRVSPIRARLSTAPERKSPLSCVLYVDG